MTQELEKIAEQAGGKMLTDHTEAEVREANHAPSQIRERRVLGMHRLPDMQRHEAYGMTLLTSLTVLSPMSVRSTQSPLQ